MNNNNQQVKKPVKRIVSEKIRDFERRTYSIAQINRILHLNIYAHSISDYNFTSRRELISPLDYMKRERNVNEIKIVIAKTYELFFTNEHDERGKKYFFKLSFCAPSLFGDMAFKSHDMRNYDLTTLFI
jgi:hypothetical protein